MRTIGSFRTSLADVLRRGELIGLEDRQLAGVGGDFRGELAGDPELAAAFGEQRLEVEGDFAAAGRDRRAFVVEDLQQRFVGGAVGRAPEAFGLRGFQRPFGDFGSELVQRPGGRPGEGREPRREGLFQFGLDVDVGEEFVGEVVGELGPDLVVLQELVAGVHPVVGVERLAVDPDREDRQERDQGGDDQQRGDDPAVSRGADLG